MKKLFYAVRIGKEPGVYETWEECKSNVSKHRGASYKSFKTREEAEAFVSGDGRVTNGVSSEKEVLELATEKGVAIAYVDGSYNIKTGTYGYGGTLSFDDQKIVIKGCGNEPGMAGMRNVAGEILGCMEAIKRSVELGLKKVVVIYDYLGIEKWAYGEWKRNHPETQSYHEFINEHKEKIEIEFIKVKSHIGIEGNEEADVLAKQAVGILPS